MDFYGIAYILDMIDNEASKLGKEALLRKYADVEGFKDVLQYIYDKNFTTGLKHAKLQRCIASNNSCSPEEIMEFLRENNTGSDLAATYANGFINQFCDDGVTMWAAEGLVTKDLQIGITLTTLNKVYGSDFIPKIGIMRGMLCPPNATGVYIATEKLDGNRRLIMTKETGVEIYTRSGKRDYGWNQLESDAARLPKNFVFDCELLAEGDFTDSIEQRQATVSRASTKSGCVAHCFDIIPLDEYNKGRSKSSALYRKMLLAYILGDKVSLFKYFETFYPDMPAAHQKIYGIFETYNQIVLRYIEAVPFIGVVHNYNEAIEMVQPYWQEGREGLMLVEVHSAYEVNPNPRTTLLKIKRTKESVCKVVGIKEGNKSNAGRCGSLTVEYKRPTNGTIWYVDVGSGLDDYQHDFYWEHPEEIIGKMVEIEHFGESQNQNGGYSLNCPRIKRIVGEEE